MPGPKSRPVTCAVCGAAVPIRPGRGRLPKYCAACRVVVRRSTPAHNRASIGRRRRRLLADPDNTIPSDTGRKRSRTVYLGAPCLRGHSGERYITGHCVTCARDKQRAWLKKNGPGPRQKEHAANYKRKRYRDDPIFRFKQTVRSSLNIRLAGRGKGVLRYLGISIPKYRIYLESKFLPEMSWGNYGPFGWHIDHIVPISAFDLADTAQRSRAFHYTNTQPLWAVDNWKKGGVRKKKGAEAPLVGYSPPYSG